MSSQAMKQQSKIIDLKEFLIKYKSLVGLLSSYYSSCIDIKSIIFKYKKYI